ncbi:MAG: hypothetical protein ACI936_000022 [Paraglaciecola sp.]|jgi:hypothetical protein
MVVDPIISGYEGIMMQSFNYKNKEVTFSSITGVIKGGLVSALEVYSTVNTNREFRITLKDGIETSVQLSDCDVLLKEGHKISLISIDNINKTGSFYVILINHDVHTQHYLLDGSVINSSWVINPYRPVTMCILAIATGLSAGIMTESQDVGFAVMSIGMLIGIFISSYSSNRVTKAIDKHLSFLSDTMIEKGKSS